jgi:hypothetical protein
VALAVICIFVEGKTVQKKWLTTETLHTLLLGIDDIIVLLWSKSLKVAFVGHIENNLYVADFSGKTTTSAICIFGKADVGWLWHHRLAHVNMRTLQSLHKGGHILGLKDSVSFANDHVCRACIQGKIHDSPHASKTIIYSKRILGLLHVDLFGPPSHASLGGKKYCLVIVDDYSKYTWFISLNTRVRPNKLSSTLPKKLNINLGKIYWQ